MKPADFVENATLEWFHASVDYQPGQPGSAGCAPCGAGGGFEDPGLLPTLQIGRIHRYWYTGSDFRQSFGPGVAWNYDTSLILYPNWSGQKRIRVWDPNTVGKWFFTNDQDQNGVYTNYDRRDMRDIIVYDAADTPVHDFTQGVRAVLTRHDGVTFHFELIRTSSNPAEAQRFGRLTRLQDRNGNAVVISYVHAANASDASMGGDRTRLWQSSTVVDAYGRTATIAYGATQVGGRWAISSIGLPNGSTLTYTYGAYAEPLTTVASGLTRIDYPDGTATVLSTHSDPVSGKPTLDIFDAAAIGGNRQHLVQFHFGNRVSRLTNGMGEITYLNWSETIAGKSWTGIFNGGYEILQVQIPFGIVDRSRRAINATLNTPLKDIVYEDILDKTTQNSFVRETSAKDAFGRIDAWTLTNQSVIDTKTFPDGTTTIWTYNEFNQPLTFKDRLNRNRAWTYDANGNCLTRTEGAGSSVAATWNFTYNARGQLETARDPLFDLAKPTLHQTTFNYNSAGYLIQAIQPADTAVASQASRTFTWAPTSGRLTGSTDDAGRQATYAYDSRDRLTGITYQDTSSETIAYGSGANANQVVETVDRNGNSTRFAYDPAGRISTTTRAFGSPEAVTEICTWLTGTVLKTSCTKRGETTTYTYDHSNRVASVTVTPRVGVALTSNTEYDQIDRRRSSTDPYGRRTFLLYDINDRLTRTVRELIPGALTAPAITPDSPLTGTSGTFFTSTTWTDARDLWLSGLTRDLSANPASIIEDMVHDSAGQMTARVDARGIRSTYQFDARGRLTESVAAEAQLASGGSFDVLLPPEAARMQYTYDAASNLITQTLPRTFARLTDGTWTAGAEGIFRTTRTYTGRNLRASETVADGLDAANQVRSERATTSWGYSPTGKIALLIDARNNSTTYTYEPCCDRLRMIIDPSGAVSMMDYDNFGNRISMEDANNNTTTWTYDGLHRPVTMTNGANELTRMAYDDDVAGGLNFPGLPGGVGSYSGLSTYLAGLTTGLGLGAGADGSALLTINPAGEFSVQLRDGLGRTTRSVDGNRFATTLSYDTVVAGLVETAQADPLNHITRTRADGAGRIRSAFDAENNAATQAFDANGNRVSIRDPSGTGMDCTFDARNRDIFCTDTRGDVVVERETTYDSHGNVVRRTDPLDKDDVCVFDARDRKISCTDRVNATTSFFYDDENNLVQIVDAQNGVTDYAYDNRNLLETEKFPADPLANPSEKRTVRSYTYDPGRRLTDRLVTTDPFSAFSELTQYAYDNANRLLGRGYADGLNDGFQYDLASRLTAATSDRYRVDVSRAYDLGSRLTTETQTYRDGKQSGNTISAQAYSVIYGYDAANRTTTLTYPDGATVTRAYTDRNQLQQVTHKLAGSSSTATVATRLYDDAGKLGTTTYGNSLVESRSYLPDSNLVATIAIPGVTSFTYSYDANSRKTQESNGILAQDTQVFGYDDQDRLTLWTRPNVADIQEWTLSAVGDWLTSTRVGVTETRTHSAVHELTGRTVGTDPTIPLSYDAKGNLTDDGEGRVYAWDPENRLSQANVTGSASPTGFGLVASYQYDALGRRVAKTWGGKTTRYLCAGAQVVEERDSTPVPSQASLTGADKDGSLANAALTPATGGILPAGSNGPVQRVNFQPPTEAAPAGYLKDAGSVFGVRTNGQSYGWNLGVSGTSRVRRGAVPIPELDTLIHMQKGGPTKTWEYALPNGSYPVIVVAGDPSYRDQTNNLSIEGIQVIDPDPSASQGYEKGDFDGYAVQVTITDGRLTIQPGSGAVNAKICYVEIGAQGTTIDQATQDRLAALIESATTQTAATVQSTTAKRQYVFGSYIDELLSYTNNGTRYFTHSNHLYSPSAVTNAAGQVQERYRYDAYGKQTITTATGTTRNQSAVGFSRGFTGYILDEETGLYYARARMYSAGLGRFINRDELSSRWRGNVFVPTSAMGYQDGWSLYYPYFVPNLVDPSGRCTEGSTYCTPKGAKLGSGSDIDPSVIDDFAAGIQNDIENIGLINMAGDVAKIALLPGKIAQALKSGTKKGAGKKAGSITEVADRLKEIGSNSGMGGGFSIWVKLTKFTCVCPPAEGQWDDGKDMSIQVKYVGEQGIFFTENHLADALGLATGECANGGSGPVEGNPGGNTPPSPVDDGGEP